MLQVILDALSDLIEAQNNKLPTAETAHQAKR